MFYVYVLQSDKDKKLYIGFTNDLKKRLREHVQGKSLSTQSRRPLRLVYYESYASSEDARNRESRLKRFDGSYSNLKRRIKRSLMQDNS